jgi:hypothetical protein
LATLSQVTGAAPVVDIALLEEEATANVEKGVAAPPIGASSQTSRN